MVLESDNSEWRPKRSPPSPRAGRIEDPLLLGGDNGSSPTGPFLVERRIASTARTSPVLFHPPFSVFKIGHIGLLLRQANFAILDAINPSENAETFASNLPGCAL